MKAQTIGNRIREVRATIAQQQFASDLGITRSYLSDLERNKFKPGRKLLQKISDAFNINVSWLLYGEGLKERQTQSQAEAVAEDTTASTDVTWHKGDLMIRVRNIDLERQYPSRPRSPEMVSIPFLAMPVTAGIPGAVEDNYQDSFDWLVSTLPQESRKHKLAALEIKGNSMSPSLPEGAICVIDLDQRDPTQLMMKIVVAKIKNECVVKRLEAYRGSLVLTSDNLDCPPILVGPDVSILGRVIKALWSPD